jgi:DNA-binding response OmpR family regulator
VAIVAVRDRSAIRPVFVPDPRRALIVADRSGLVLDERTGQASYDGTRVSLSIRQFDLLFVLVSNPGRLITSSELAEHAWGERQDSSETVRSAVKAIRSRLRAAGASPVILATVWGLGFRWDGASTSKASELIEIAS